MTLRLSTNRNFQADVVRTQYKRYGCRLWPANVHFLDNQVAQELMQIIGDNRANNS